MDSYNLVLGLLFGAVGIGYFIYGRRQEHLVAKYTGVALMVYPYFVSNTLAMLVVGAVLMLVPRFVDF